MGVGCTLSFPFYFHRVTEKGVEDDDPDGVLNADVRCCADLQSSGPIFSAELVGTHSIGFSIGVFSAVFC